MSGGNNRPEAERSNCPASQHGATFVDTDTQPTVPIFSAPPVAPAISLGRYLQQEGIPNFDDPYKHHHDPLGLPQYQLPLSAIQSVGPMHPIFRGPHQFHHPSPPSFDWQLRSPHTPTESRTTVSSSSHCSVSITSGSVPSLGRLKQPRAWRGSKKGSGKLNMSNLGSYPPEVQEILRIAKLSFVIESFAAGLFWAHQKSRLRSAYNENLLWVINIVTTRLGAQRTKLYIYIP